MWLDTLGSKSEVTNVALEHVLFCQNGILNIQHLVANIFKNFYLFLASGSSLLLKGYSLVAGGRLLIVTVEYKLQGVWASVVVM